MRNNMGLKKVQLNLFRIRLLMSFNEAGEIKIKNCSVFLDLFRA